VEGVLLPLVLDVRLDDCHDASFELTADPCPGLACALES
jgi:hypothetical protein